MKFYYFFLGPHQYHCIQLTIPKAAGYYREQNQEEWQNLSQMIEDQQVCLELLTIPSIAPLTLLLIRQKNVEVRIEFSLGGEVLTFDCM